MGWITAVLIGTLLAVFVATAFVLVLIKYLKSSVSEKEKMTRAQEESTPKKTGVLYKVGESIWDAMRHPAFFIAIGVIMFNWLTWALNKNFWLSLYNDPSRFWSVNIGLWLAIVLFLVKKDEGKSTHPIAKGISAVMIILLGLIILSSIYEHVKNNASGSTIQSRTVTNLSRGVPWSVARLYISGCESGDGTPGSGRHLNNKGEVKLGEQNPRDIGLYQINLDQQATLIKELKADPYKEEDNERLAMVLYGREEFGPWFLSRNCWESRLTSAGYSQVLDDYVRTVIAPVGDFGEEITIDEGYYCSWRWSDDGGDAFEIKNQRGLTAIYDPNNNVIQKTPYPSSRISFRSLGDKPVTIKLKFARHPLVDMG